MSKSGLVSSIFAGNQSFFFICMPSPEESKSSQTGGPLIGLDEERGEEACSYYGSLDFRRMESLFRSNCSPVACKAFTDTPVTGVCTLLNTHKTAL